MTECNYRWMGTDRVVVHRCDLDVDHVGMPHACHCGVRRPLGHDDSDDVAVAEMEDR